MVSKRIWPTRTEDLRERQGFRRGQNDDNFEKANKVTGDVENNIPTLTGDGDLKDSGKSFSDVKLKKSSTRTITSDYQIVESDEIIWIDAGAGDVTVTVMDPTNITGQTFEIQRIDSSSNTAFVSGGAFLINGQAIVELKRQKDYIKPTSIGSEYFA